jgi:glycosyltransferase involved in cell wall biosynthesis
MAKILYISFGYEPLWGGGMVKNQLGLMKNLIITGHAVTYFTAGRYDFKRKIYLRPRKISGIRAIEMVNSPNFYDPYGYCTNPENHCSNIEIERLLTEVIESAKPDLVHISDLRMHTASVIEIVKRFDLPIVKTIENFGDLCPKGDLMFKDELPCIDFDEGKKCLMCLSKYKKQVIPITHRIKGSIHYEHYFPIIAKIGWLKKLIPKAIKQTTASFVQYSPKAYANRRKFFIEMLNKCDVVHTTSKNIAQRFINCGINPEIIRTIPLSAEGLSEINPRSDFEPKYPITFGYRGKLHTRKGVQILLAAFSRLDQEKCRLIIYGDGDLSFFSAYDGNKLNIDYRGTYRKNQINRVLKEIDIGVVPSIWEEVFGIVGLEYINARIPIIASNIGGISEWLKDGENGFLFNPGDSYELFSIMKRFLRNPSLITQLQKKIKPWKNMKAYAQEMSTLYKSLIHNNG